MSNQHLTLRAIESPDLAFVVAAWLKSFRRSPYAGVIPNDLYHSTYKNCFDQLLQRGMKVVVACNKANPDQLVGFVAYETAQNGTVILHYLFVKDVFRGNGIGKMLLAHANVKRGAPFIYTFRTSDSRKLHGGKHVPAVARRKSLEPIYETTP